MKTLLLLFSAGKFGKIFLSALSMIISLVTYSFIYGWKYSLGFIGLLLLHELGHYQAAKIRNLDVGLPTFIPFVGAWIELKEQPLNAEAEAYIGISGPMLGSFGAYIIYLFSYIEDSKLLIAIAYSGFILNLFNLIPLSPLDGGRIMNVISPKIWYVGMPLLLFVFFYNQSPLLLIIAILAIPRIWGSFHESTDSNYYATNFEIKLQYGFYYILLIAFLASLSFEAHNKLLN